MSTNFYASFDWQGLNLPSRIKKLESCMPFPNSNQRLVNCLKFNGSLCQIWTRFVYTQGQISKFADKLRPVPHNFPLNYRYRCTCWQNASLIKSCLAETQHFYSIWEHNARDKSSEQWTNRIRQHSHEFGSKIKSSHTNARYDIQIRSNAI